MNAIAETLLREAAESITTPEPNECLQCFVARMLDAFGCDGELSLARRYRDLVAPRAVAMERRLGAAGGYCDCEIFLNGWWLHPRLDRAREVSQGGALLREVPEPVQDAPACGGVRRGSTQPCANWVRRTRHPAW